MSVSRSALASSAARSAWRPAARPPSRLADAPRAMRAHALDALALRAQLAVVDHLVQPRHARLERLLAVLVEEELGIGQARPHDALVASTMRAGSSGRMLLTTRNLSVSRPVASSSGKYFWLAFIVRIRHSGGTARNSRSNRHISTFGRSTSAVTSSSSASSSIGRRPCARPRLAAAGASISARRAAKPAITAPSRSSCCGVAVGVAQLDRIDVAASKRWPCVLRPRRQAERRSRHHLVAVQRHQAVRRPHEVHAWSSRRRAGSSSAWGSAARRALRRARSAGPASSRAGTTVLENSASALPSTRAFQRAAPRRPGAQSRPASSAAPASAGPGRRAPPPPASASAAAARSARLRQHVRDVHRQAARRGEGRSPTASAPARPCARRLAATAGEGLAQLLQRLAAAAPRRTARPAGSAWSHQAAFFARAAPAPRRPRRAAPSESPAARGCRGSSAPPRAPGCGCGRCRRRVRSR